jgi:hypothetical protein
VPIWLPVLGVEKQSRATESHQSSLAHGKTARDGLTTDE